MWTVTRRLLRPEAGGVTGRGGGVPRARVLKLTNFEKALVE